MYVAVKGGEAAISNAHRLLADRRRGDRSVPSLTLAQIAEQLALACDRVMAEGSVYDRELAALAIKQARGDLIEAIFLLRAYRTTLPRFGYSVPIDTAAMQVERRVSATYKDLPGGQMLGPTFDYTHRLLDPSLGRDGDVDAPEVREGDDAKVMRVSDILAQEGLIEDDGDVPGEEIGDITRTPMEFPMERDTRLQALARRRRGLPAGARLFDAARLCPLASLCRRDSHRRGRGEARRAGTWLCPSRSVASQVTECQMVTQFAGSAKVPPQFTRGYGLVFGQSERKAMAMALCDRALRASELGEDIVAPAQDQEFVISHSDNVQATGFVEHLKLPHYVDFQAELDLVRRMRGEHAARRDIQESMPEAAE